jgi:hypothetical protein
MLRENWRITDADDFAALQRFQDTLTSLYCRGGTLSLEQLRQRILLVAKNVPKLKHLTYAAVLDLPSEVCFFSAGLHTLC